MAMNGLNLLWTALAVFVIIVIVFYVAAHA
jgi:hypothetical protein